MTDKALRDALKQIRNDMETPCSCTSDYTDRGLTAPDCIRCRWSQDVFDIVDAALSTPEPSLTGDLVEVLQAVMREHGVVKDVTVTKAVLVALKERGTVMGCIRDYDTREIVECRRPEDTKHLTLPPVLVLPLEGSE
jgi:hypothetical protein